MAKEHFSKKLLNSILPVLIAFLLGGIIILAVIAQRAGRGDAV